MILSNNGIRNEHSLGVLIIGGPYGVGISKNTMHAVDTDVFIPIARRIASATIQFSIDETSLHICKESSIISRVTLILIFIVKSG